MSVIKLDKDNFDREINCGKTVLVDFYADWCGPCRMLSPVVDEVAEENPQYFVGKVNVDEQGALAEKFEVYSIPTLVVFKNGKETDRLTGVYPKEQILEILR